MGIIRPENWRELTPGLESCPHGCRVWLAARCVCGGVVLEVMLELELWR